MQGENGIIFGLCVSLGDIGSYMLTLPPTRQTAEISDAVRIDDVAGTTLGLEHGSAEAASRDDLAHTMGGDS